MSTMFFLQFTLQSPSLFGVEAVQTGIAQLPPGISNLNVEYEKKFFTFIVCWKRLGRVFCDTQVTWEKLPDRPLRISFHFV